MHVNSTCKEAILDFEGWIKMKYSRSQINIYALEDNWYYVFLMATSDDIDWILYLCIAFGKRKLAKYLYEKLRDKEEPKSTIHHVLDNNMQISELILCIQSSQDKEIIGVLTPELIDSIKQHIDFDIIKKQKRNLLDGWWYTTKINIGSNIPYWEYYPDLYTKTWHMKFITQNMLNQCIDEGSCNNSLPYIIDVLRYFGFESLSLKEFLNEM